MTGLGNFVDLEKIDRHVATFGLDPCATSWRVMVRWESTTVILPRPDSMMCTTRNWRQDGEPGEPHPHDDPALSKQRRTAAER